MQKLVSCFSLFLIILFFFPKTSFGVNQLGINASADGNTIYYSFNLEVDNPGQGGNVLVQIYSGNLAGDLVLEEFIPVPATNSSETVLGPFSWRPNNSSSSTFQMRASLYPGAAQNPAIQTNSETITIPYNTRTIDLVVLGVEGEETTESVEYIISGENYPATQENLQIFVEIREGGETSNNIVYETTINEPVNEDGYFNTGIQSWTPLTQGQLPQANTFTIKAYVDNQLSPVQDTESFETQGVAEAVETITANTNESECRDGDGVYCLLEPIGTNDNLWTFFNARDANSFGKYLNGMFQLGVAFAGIIGVLLIVIGGFQYMTTDAIGKKEDGRKQIMNAVYGVILALTAWLILNTINPNLLNFSIGAYETTGVQGGSPNQTGVVLSQENENVTGVCQQIAQAAADAAANNLSTCNAPNTGGGNYACAWLVDTLIEDVTGSYLGGSTGPELATANLIGDLQGNGSYQLVGSIPPVLNPSSQTIEQLRTASQAGDIIISPTSGSNTGHVGICVSSDCAAIVSNSSSQHTASQNFTFNNWVTTYKNLNLSIFRHTDCVQGG